MRSDRPKEFRLSSWSLPRVALTGVDIYIKLQETYNGERKLESAQRCSNDFILREMIIGSLGREVRPFLVGIFFKKIKFILPIEVVIR